MKPGPAYARQGNAGHAVKGAWLTGFVDEAMQLQCPLSPERLGIVAKNTKTDDDSRLGDKRDFSDEAQAVVFAEVIARLPEVASSSGT